MKIALPSRPTAVGTILVPYLAAAVVTLLGVVAVLSNDRFREFLALSNNSLIGAVVGALFCCLNMVLWQRLGVYFIAGQNDATNVRDKIIKIMALLCIKLGAIGGFFYLTIVMFKEVIFVVVFSFIVTLILGSILFVLISKRICSVRE